MKTREEQIAEMAKEMRNYGYKRLCAGRVFYYGFCEHLYDAGYRKQSDTVKEFIDRISEFASAVRLLEYKAYDEESRLVKAMYAMGKIDEIGAMMREIKKLAKEYGVEVEE